MPAISKSSPLPAARTIRYPQRVSFDTFVANDGNLSNDNDEFLVVKLDDYGPGHRVAYLGFDTSRFKPGYLIGELQLMFHTNAPDDDGTIEIYSVEDHSFWNTSFTYANRPPHGEQVASFSMKDQDPDGWVTVSITDAATVLKLLGTGKMSIMLQGSEYRQYHRFSSSRDQHHSPTLTAITRLDAIKPSQRIRYLNFICTMEENNFSMMHLSEIDIIDHAGKRLDKQDWTVVDATLPDGWQHLFDNDRQTHYSANHTTPIYLTIDLQTETSISAVVFSPKLTNYQGRPADVLIHGKSDVASEWTLIGSRNVPHGDGNAPHVVFTGASAAASQVEKTFSIPIRTSASIEKARLKHRLARSTLNVTGLHFNQPGIVCIWIESSEPKASDFFEACEGPWASSVRHRLQYGLNAFHFSSVAGALYLQLASAASDDNGRIAFIRIMAEHVDLHPVFESRVTSPADWQNMLKNRDTTNVIEMVSQDFILTMRGEDFLPFADDIDMQALADTYDASLVPTQLGAGVMKGHSNPLHRPDANPFHFVSRENGYMAAGENRLYYQYNLTPRMLTEAGTFWGIWHEVGHALQTTGLAWSGQSEVSVNIYAFAQRAWSSPLGELAKNYDTHFENAFTELDNVQDYSQLSPGSREFIFHHLFFIYGEKNMYALHQRYRANLAGDINDPEFSIGATDAESMNVMAMISSKVTSTDLTPFYLFWKFPLTDQTLDTIKGFGFSPIADFEKMPSELILGVPPEDYDMIFDET